MKPMHVIALLWALAGSIASPATAQDSWPNKPVRVIVNFAPGGSTDNAARPFAYRLSQAIGQQFVIENKPGASGTIGVEAGVRSAPDGYTFFVVGSPVLTIVPQARKLSWDPFKDMIPVAHFGDYLLPIAVHASIPVNSIQELAAYSKANPGKLNCGSAGLGTLTHVICETLKRSAGVDSLHVPYRGGAEALSDFLAGVTQIHSEPNVMPHFKTGKVKLLAIADRERHPDYPNVPLISELYPEIDVVGWFGLFAPVGTPPAIVARVNAEMNAIAKMPEIKAQFHALALRATSGPPEALAALLKTDYERYGRLIKEINLRLE